VVRWLEASRSVDRDLDEWNQRIKVPTLTRSIGSRMSCSTPTHSAAWVPIRGAMQGSRATCSSRSSIDETSSTGITVPRYFLPCSSRTCHPRVGRCDAALTCSESQYCPTGLKPADDQTGDVSRLVQCDLEKVSGTFQRSSHLGDAACSRPCFEERFISYLGFAACCNLVRLWFRCCCKHALSNVVFCSNNDRATDRIFPPRECVVDSRSSW